MLRIVAAILAVLWLAGMVFGIRMVGFLHFLLLFAVMALMVRQIRKERFSKRR